MKKIINPFDNYCIGCSPNNSEGLQMEFQYDEENSTVISNWNPIDKFQGYPNVLHGGIQSLMMDEIAAWSIYIFLETAGVTKNLSVNFQNPVFLSNGTITLKCRLKSSEKRSAILSVELFDGLGKLCTTSEIEYFIYPKSIAVKKFHYPGLDAFFKD